MTFIYCTYKVTMKVKVLQMGLLTSAFFAFICANMSAILSTIAEFIFEDSSVELLVVVVGVKFSIASIYTFLSAEKHN